jgi:hypothetical protein
MKAVLVPLIVWLLVGIAPGFAAAGPRSSGFEISGGSWHAVDPSAQAYTLSIGRWQRLARPLTWVTRLAYWDVEDWPLARFPEATNRGLGHSVVIETGIQVHPPVSVGLAPYLGATLGAGAVRWGDERSWDQADPRGGWIVTRGTMAFACAAGVELGVRALPQRPWPSACLALGLRVTGGSSVGGVSAAPILTIGY